MKNEILAFFPYVELTCFGLLLFAGSYTAVIWSTYRKSSRKRFQYIETLPLDEDFD